MDNIKQSLQQTYNNHAEERESKTELETWKAEEREAFLQILLNDGKRSLLEIGAGPGRDSRYFAENGLEVTCTDLSPEMVRICSQHGLDAHQLDFYDLRFPGNAFDAVYALNCLLHVPKADLPDVLIEIGRVLRPQGLLYIGVYGGKDSEGIWKDDSYEPKRFFSFYTDEQLLKVVQRHFKIEAFKVVNYQSEGLHFQSLVLRKE